jgi:hypothetical protein
MGPLVWNNGGFQAFIQMAGRRRKKRGGEREEARAVRGAE